MRKLLNGIAEFRRNRRPEYAATFARLALVQTPDALFVACSDSRVVPNLFASTQPGDLFVVRNMGNLIPPCGSQGRSESDESEAAAIEFSVGTLRVRDVIVCGHSECGAMRALHAGLPIPGVPDLEGWLRHARAALDRLNAGAGFPGELPPYDKLSQLNVLLQLEHLQTYPLVRQSVAEGRLRIHAWWFDIAQANVFAFEATENRFVLLDEQRVVALVATLS